MSNGKTPIESPWSRPVEEVLDILEVNPDIGLNEEIVRDRRADYGKNRLKEVRSRSVLDILIDQFKSLMVAILLVASVLALFFGDLAEAIAIGIVIVLNATIGFATELKAVRSMEAFQELQTVRATVRRNGEVTELEAEKVVPGDVVLVENGDIVTADLRLIETSKMQADESALTGESVPVSKNIESVDPDTPVADRSCMAYKGTAITKGSGTGIAVRTGMQTEIGTISFLVQKAEQKVTPLEERLSQLSHRLVWVTLVVGFIVIIMGVISGKDFVLMIETGVALAVATVPEGLPLVATLGLARGMWRMAQRNAIVEKLSSVETLGTTSVICTDKTGTLTESRMTVTTIMFQDYVIKVTGTGMDLEGEFLHERESISPRDNMVLQALLEVGLFANETSTEPETIEDGEASIGDPLEVALAIVGMKAGIDPQELFDSSSQVRKVAFDPQEKMMASYNQDGKDIRVSVKGAPEEVLDVCQKILTENGPEVLDEEAREDWKERGRRLAADGLRVIGFAHKRVEEKDIAPYSKLTFIGLAGLLDPAREEVRSSLLACIDAGIRVVMVTGDHPETAEKIAEEVGLLGNKTASTITGGELKDPDTMSEDAIERVLEANVLARVSPEQKLDLIEIHQREDRVVAMTGDGVNDAPALKKADIGVAMGQRGTQVAQEAADIVLRDDRFSTIVYAIEEGRVIFNNIRNFVLYLLSCNMSEIILIALFSLLPVPLPIHPLQILFLNLVTDVFPALALGVSEGDPSVMDRSPRGAEEPIITKGHWITVGGYGSLITVSVLGAFGVSSLFYGIESPVTGAVVFLTLAFAQLWHVFNMRLSESDILKNEVTGNIYVWVALLICVPLLIIPVYVPFLSALLDLVALGLLDWTLIFAMSFIPLVIGQLWKEISTQND